MPDTPSAPKLKPLRKKGTAYGPGLTSGVLVVAALAFFLLMGSGSLFMVQTLRATQEETQAWPVAKKRVRPLAGQPPPGMSAADEAALSSDFPTGRPAPQTVVSYSDPWMRYFPEVAAQQKFRPEWTRENYNKLMFNTSRVGSWGWARYDPASPFSFAVPDTRLQARMRDHMEAYDAWMAAGQPEIEAPGLSDEEEAELDASAKARDKKYKAMKAKEKPEEANRPRS